MNEKKSFWQSMTSLNKTFWLASFMELMERWAWYGIFTPLGIYLVGSTDEGALGFNHIQKGNIMGNITAILYLLPIFFGVIADRIGYKLSLSISFIVMIAGYYLMGDVTSYWGVYLSFLLVAFGAAFFKPVASAIVARNTDETTGNMGFGIFYMMVNIGGFIGPASSSYLRTQFGWKLIFIQAATVIAINLVILWLFYKEKPTPKHKQPLWHEVKNSVNNIIEALKDKKLTVLLILMIGFWTMFNQLFYTLPNFIEDWVDSTNISNWINRYLPNFLSTLITQDGQVKAEWFSNLDALMIIFLQIPVSYFVTKMKHINAIIRGAIVATIGVSLTFYTGNALFTILGTVIFAIGEMASSPTLSSFIANITPKGKEGLYQGTYFLPVAAGNYFTGFISGNLYQKWSDKLSLLKTEMASRGISMPQVVSKEEYIEKASSVLRLSISDFEKMFNTKQSDVDWAKVHQSVVQLANDKGIGLADVHLPFSKREYFELAEQKLQLSHWEMTNMLWDNYQPNKIWYVVCGVGVLSIIALIVYNRYIVKGK